MILEYIVHRRVIILVTLVLEPPTSMKYEQCILIQEHSFLHVALTHLRNHLEPNQVEHNRNYLNVDALTLAVVARDEKGIILKAWTTNILSNDSLVAKAAAILWAVQLAKRKQFQKIGDVKLCFDAINGEPDVILWSISIFNTMNDAGCQRYK